MTVSTILLVLSLVMMFSFVAMIFKIKQIDRLVADPNIIYVPWVIVGGIHLALILIFSIDDPNGEVPTAPTFIWAVTRSTSIITSVLVGLFISFMVVVRVATIAGLKFE